jgi:membrane-associated HD superfamily phosphohydrolase
MIKTMTKKEEKAPELETKTQASEAEAKTQMKAEVQEEVVVSNSYVETLWGQYEQMFDQARKLRESGEEAYLKSVKDVIKLNKDFRKSIFDLYTESRKSNREIVNGLPGNFEKNDGLNQYTQQVEDISDRVENLAITPIKFTVNLIESIEKNVEESSEAYVHYSRESQRVWGKVTNEYMKIAKNNHKMLVNQLEESVKVLVGTNRN